MTQTPPIIFDYLKLEMNPPKYLSQEPGKYGSKLLDKQISIQKVMDIKTLELLDNIMDIKTAIDIYKNKHKLWENWQNKTVTMTSKQFLERVPSNISVQKLKSLVINHQDCFIMVSGAKKVVWQKGLRLGKNFYQPSGIKFVFTV